MTKLLTKNDLDLAKLPEGIVVQSSNIFKIRYEEGQKLLGIEFTSGSKYLYENVSPEEATKLLNAPSIGAYFNRHIKNSYPFSKI